MLFQKKVDRAMDWLTQQNKDKNDKGEQDYEIEESIFDQPDQPEVFKRKKKKLFEKSSKEDYLDVEKNDLPALMIAAFLIFVPAIALILGLFVLIAWLFF